LTASIIVIGYSRMASGLLRLQRLLVAAPPGSHHWEPLLVGSL
jgi:hypothetical protein